MIIRLPKSLELKLGQDGSADLIHLLNEAEMSGRNQTLELIEARFEKKLELEISGLRTELVERMDAGFMDIQKQFTGVEGRFVGIERRFSDMEHRFSGIYKELGLLRKEITNQTKWTVAMISFLAVALKLMDLLFA